MHRKVLVIDDEEAIVIVLKASLEATTDWQIITCSSATKGIAIATTEYPDIVLLDVSMPKVDGTQVFKALQTEALTQNIPVIFLTAKARVSEQQILKALGVSGIILKPFSPETIAAQIKEILGWKD
ncbi:MAG: response regulator [Cyanobacteria bacterium P01_D01_bin.36]